MICETSTSNDRVRSQVRMRDFRPCNADSQSPAQEPGPAQFDCGRALSPCAVKDLHDASLKNVCLQLETASENHLLDGLDDDLPPGPGRGHARRRVGTGAVVTIRNHEPGARPACAVCNVEPQ